MVKVVVYSHDWAEVEVCVKGKPKRCEINLEHDLFVDKEAHKEELHEIREMEWSELKKKYRGCH
jgi:hypothetical protein